MLAIERTGTAPELTISLRWRPHEPIILTYAQYPEERQTGAVERTDAYLVAEVDGHVAGLLMIIVPSWPYATGAGEITDLAVGRAHRRAGVGNALIAAAVAFARKKGLRALWVEPTTDNHSAIEFYLSLGFRISGFNDRLNSNGDDEDGRTPLLMYLDVPAAGTPNSGALAPS